MPLKDRSPSSGSIDVQVKRPGLRIAAIVALIAIALAAIGYGVMTLLQGDGSGWMEMTVDAAAKDTCGEDFRLMVDLDALTTAGRKEISLAYTQASQEAFALFHPTRHFDSTVNLYDLSAHPGEALTVPPALYRALELTVAADPRWITLAPVYQVYQSLALSTVDREAEDFSPRRSPEAAAYVQEALTYCTDPAHISLELLGENQVCLHVSEAYAAFARENDVPCYLDFYWMKNAFITDYLADALAAKGLTRAVLTSKEGYGACLDTTDAVYSLNVFHPELAGNSPVAVVGYTGPLRMVTFRSTPLVDLGYQDLYYLWEDGEIDSPYVSPATGLDTCALSELLSCSREKSCGELALTLAPFYVAETWSPASVDALTRDGVWSVYWQDGAPRLNDPTAAELALPEE